MNFNKHNYLGEHRGKANILLTATIEDEFSITLEDEQNDVKSSWEMTMHKEDAEKVIRKAAEMLGVIPIYECRSCKNNGYAKGQKPALCEKCDFKKFTQKMVDIIVELMVEYDIADLDELKAKLIGGPTAKDYAEAGKALAEGIEEGMKRYCGVDMKGGET